MSVIFNIGLLVPGITVKYFSHTDPNICTARPYASHMVISEVQSFLLCTLFKQYNHHCTIAQSHFKSILSLSQGQLLLLFKEEKPL